MSENGRGYYSGNRYSTPNEFGAYRSKYDMSSAELDDLQKRGLSPVQTLVFDLSTAMPPLQAQYLNISGRAFRIKGVQTSTVYNPTTNTGIETVVNSIMVGVWVGMTPGQKGDPSKALYMKHGSGYHGDFNSLSLFWPAQSGNSVRIDIFKFDDIPWYNGDYAT